MIDLNRKPTPTPKEEEEETPLGIVILALLPFAGLFWLIMTTGMINGIF